MQESNSPELKKSLPYKNPQNAFFNGEGWEVCGSSINGKEIRGRLIEPKKTSQGKILLIGGVHGNETEGVRFMEEFTREFIINGNGGEKLTEQYPCTFYIIPVLNPDGFLNFERSNANKVDLNRNMPTKDWVSEYEEERYFPGKAPASEPETKALLDVLEKFNPDFIISFHSWKPMINTNGPAESFANKIAERLDMVIEDDIGYPTPGSLGTYAGWERKIPTITLEFERGIELDTVYPQAREGILNSFTVFSQSR